MFIKCIVGLSLAALCLAEPPTGNYLPPSPTQGYSYQPPSVPFPSPQKPPSPPPSYTPTGPSSPPYRPPAPAPPPPPSAPAPRPSYGPPTGPAPVIPSGTGNLPTYGEHDHLNQPHVPGMPYDFNYVVKDDYFGTDYSHNAVSDGDVVKGEYRVQLPDGRLQIVRYTADWKTGFHADVQYEGQASYPDSSQGYPAAGKPPGPSYGPPTTGGGY